MSKFPREIQHGGLRSRSEVSAAAAHYSGASLSYSFVSDFKRNERQEQEPQRCAVQTLEQADIWGCQLLYQQLVPRFLFVFFKKTNPELPGNVLSICGDAVAIVTEYQLLSGKGFRVEKGFRVVTPTQMGLCIVLDSLDSP